MQNICSYTKDMLQYERHAPIQKTCSNTKEPSITKYMHLQTDKEKSYLPVSTRRPRQRLRSDPCNYCLERRPFYWVFISNQFYGAKQTEDLENRICKTNNDRRPLTFIWWMIAHGFKLNHLYSSVAPGLAKVDKREKNLAKAILSISKGCSLLIARSWQWRNKIWSRPWQCLKVTTEIIQSYQGSEGNGNTCCRASILWPSLFLEENISFINCYFNMNNKKTKDKIIELNILENIYGTQAKGLPWRKYQLHQLLLQHEQQKHKGHDHRDNIPSNIYGT